jgi:hypothetical protein
MLTLKVFYRVS